MYQEYTCFDFGKLAYAVPLTRAERSYFPDFLCFDIETTAVTLKERTKTEAGVYFSFIYLWQLNIFGEVVIGRTFPQFVETMEKLLEHINETVVIYVHNLSYEFQFLKSYFEFDDILATSTRKVIVARSGRIEWRCSYRLANMSLAEFSRIWGGGELKEEKIDYMVYRSSTEELESDVIKYGVMDVVAQRASIKGRMAAENDDVASVPITATGYVRRAIRQNVGYWGIKNMQVPMSEEIYAVLSEAFRGGNTHANRYYAGQIIRNVRCFDRVSSYPDVQCREYYPVSEFKRSLCSTTTALETAIERACVLVRMVCYGVKLRNAFDGFPPMSVHKCWLKRDVDVDNGRVLAAGAIGVTLTDVDYKIFMAHYQVQRVEIEKVYTSRRRQLPAKLIETIYSFFQKKTEYKSVEGKETEYLRAKENNNSVYGMSAQKPILGEYLLNDGMLEYEERELISAALDEDSHRRIMPYQYGVWVTANARQNLEFGLREDTIYCDTDSTYTDRKNDIFKGYNAKLRQYYAERNMIPIDHKGNEQVLGSFQLEPGVYSEFVTWGAKKYAGVVDGELKITIAGVPKKEGAKQLAKDGGLQVFRPGYVFLCECNSAATYNDDMDLWHNGEHVLSNMHINRTHYKLGISDDYNYLLDYIGRSYKGHVL